MLNSTYVANVQVLGLAGFRVSIVIEIEHI